MQNSAVFAPYHFTTPMQGILNEPHQGRFPLRVQLTPSNLSRIHNVVEPVNREAPLSLQSRVIKKLDHLADHPGEVLYQWLPTIAKCSLGLVLLGATAGAATGVYCGILAWKSAFALAHPWVAGALGMSV